MQKKTQEVFIDYQIIAFPLVVVNTRFYWERILVFVCQYVNRQSQDFRYYWNRVFRADFPSECSNNMTKILPCTFMHCFGTFNMFTVHMCADIGLFGHLSNPVFCSLQFEKKKNLWVSSIFSKCYIFYVDSENPEKIEKIYVDFEIVAFELVPLNSRFYWERILVIGCQYVNKQSQNFRYY